MTSSMPIGDSFPGLARTLFSMFQSGGSTFLNGTRLHPEFLVDEMKNKLVGGYHDVQQAVSRYIPNAAPGTATPELLDLESQPDHDHHVTNISQKPEVVHAVCNLNSPSTTQTDDSEIKDVEQAACREPLTHPKHTRTQIVALIVGVLTMIVVPGLVVGVMTRQVSWGVELSGAIAPIVSLLAGLYYHHNK